jgi:hypothetical protein
MGQRYSPSPDYRSNSSIVNEVGFLAEAALGTSAKSEKNDRNRKAPPDSAGLFDSKL